jgi:hypothetical protein
VNSGGLHFHKWRVVVDFAGDKCVGTIVSYRDDYHEERRPYTSKTPRTRLWKVRFFGDEDVEFEEYDPRSLRSTSAGYMMTVPAAGSSRRFPRPVPPLPPRRRTTRRTGMTRRTRKSSGLSRSPQTEWGGLQRGPRGGFLASVLSRDAHGY